MVKNKGRERRNSCSCEVRVATIAQQEGGICSPLFYSAIPLPSIGWFLPAVFGSPLMGHRNMQKRRSLPAHLLDAFGGQLGQKFRNTSAPSFTYQCSMQCCCEGSGIRVGRVYNRDTDNASRLGNRQRRTGYGLTLRCNGRNRL